MAIVTLKYIRNKEEIKAHLRYFIHRRGRETEKQKTRTIFTNAGLTDKREFYRRVSSASRGTAFFKFMISPDPKREDSRRDLDLPFITRRTIRKLEKALSRRLFFVAALHNDHTLIRHVHGVFLVEGRLSREQFRLLQEVARAEATAGSRLLRRARDLTLSNPRYLALDPDGSLPLRGRGGARIPKLQSGCARCGFGEAGGIPAYKRNCPICHASLRQERPVKFRPDAREGGYR